MMRDLHSQCWGSFLVNEPANLHVSEAVRLPPNAPNPQARTVIPRTIAFSIQERCCVNVGKSRMLIDR